MRKVTVSIIVFLFMIIMPVFAQEWSKEQQKVWEVIEKRWDNLVNNKNLEEFAKDFHSKFKGFVNWRALPIDKEILKQGADNVTKNIKFSMYVIEPISIIIHNDTAVIHYFCNTRGLAGGKPFQSEFKYTDFLIKEKGKWITIGAHKEKL